MADLRNGNMIDQQLLDWIEKRKRLITELMIAEDVVQFGKIVLKYQDGNYLDMDLHPTMKIAEIKKG